jgi:hypothetical protein
MLTMRIADILFGSDNAEVALVDIQRHLSFLYCSPRVNLI